MPESKTDFAEKVLDGIVQGALLGGQWYAFKDLGGKVKNKSNVASFGLLVTFTVTSNILLRWMKEQAFYLNI